MKLLYFAWLRQSIGRSEEDFTAPQNVSTVAHLIDTLRLKGPGYAEAFRDPARLRCAVNQRHSGFDAKIKDADEIAFFPPVTGG